MTPLRPVASSRNEPRSVITSERLAELGLDGDGSHVHTEGYHTATPFLIVRDAAVALDFYKQAFGARERMRHHDENGRMRHCEIEIGGSAIMIGGQPRAGNPRAGPLPSVSIYLYVDNADSWVRRALTSGAKEVSRVKDQYDGDRRGGVVDPFGIVWWIARESRTLLRKKWTVGSQPPLEVNENYVHVIVSLTADLGLPRTSSIRSTARRLGRMRLQDSGQPDAKARIRTSGNSQCGIYADIRA